ncbi:MAG: hypothetical protein JNK73_08005 [Bacteroidia bacterium]|nr:hypothetical protein [Bacteroidia bacterium]
MKPIVTLAFLIFLCGTPSRMLACQCPVTAMSLAECDKYEVIFRGKVLAVKSCNNKPGEALMEVLELYKGYAEKKFKLVFNCSDPCYYEFKPGEEWIIYSRYKQVNTALMDYCSRSRRYFTSAKEDYYTASNGNDYEDELKFLREKLGLHRLVETKQHQDYSRNNLPNSTQSVIILLVSIAALLGFYFIFNRYLK